jgi:hypothetical protein
MSSVGEYFGYTSSKRRSQAAWTRSRSPSEPESAKPPAGSPMARTTASAASPPRRAVKRYMSEGQS